MANRLMTEKEQIKNILLRLGKLEKELLPVKKQTAKAGDKKPEGFTGPKGGILLLISKGHLNKRRTAPDVKKELQKNDYDYRIQVVQTALNRLSKNKGPLTALTESGKKSYVKRK